MDAISGFRNRLRETLLRRGMSQTELARRLGVRVATVNEWLNRGTVPNGAVMLRLPGILGVDGHWLLTGEDRVAREGEPLPATERDRVVSLLEEALRAVRGTDAPPGEYLLLREPDAGEQRALEAVERYHRESQPSLRKRRQGRNHS